MKFNSIQPALWAAVLYAGGICLGRLTDPPLGLLLLVAFLLCGLTLLAARVRLISSLSLFPLSLALLLTACLQYEGQTRLFPRHHIIHGRTVSGQVTLRGRIISSPQIKGANVNLVLEVATIDSGSGFVVASGKILLRIKDDQRQWYLGDQIQACGRLRVPQKARNPGEFDYQEYLQREDIWATLSARADLVERTGRKSPGRLRWSAGWVRRYVNKTICENLQGPPEALLRGLLLGQRDELPADVIRAFSDAGVIHVLAVSGLHVGLIVGIFYSLFMALRFRESAATLLTLALMIFYMVVVDMRPSVVRATIMAGVVMVGRLLERDADLINIIPFAALVILIWNPQFLFELGFQLSFVATLSIVYLHRRLTDICFPFLTSAAPKWLQWVGVGLSVSLSAQLGTLPIIAYHFQKIPVISLVANLVVVPLVGLGVALGFTSLLLSPISLSLAKLYAAANWLVLKTLICLVALAANLPWSCFRVPQPSLGDVALYYLFLLLGANVKRSRAVARAFLFGALVLLNLLVWKQALVSHRCLSVLFFDVGQGDAALVCFPNGRTMLVDGGERKVGRDCGEQIIGPYLHRAGIRRLDVMVLTHADNDHVGGLPSLLETLPVDLVIDSGARHLSGTYLRFLRLAKRPDSRYREVRAGDRLMVDNQVVVQVLHPTDEFVSRDGQAPLGLNEGSLVLKLAYGRVSFLLTGDIERGAEEALLRSGQLSQNTVLKVPHHGSISSSTIPFLEAVQPQVAIISVGGENTFGHPHQEVLRRYCQLGTMVFRTDRDGAVIVKTDGRELRGKTVLKEEKWQFLLDGEVTCTSDTSDSIW